MVAHFFLFREGVFREKTAARNTPKTLFSSRLYGQFLPPLSSPLFQERFDAI
jgi:hypothetical protein